MLTSDKTVKLAGSPTTFVRRFMRGLKEIRESQQGSVSVPCGECIACCKGGFDIRIYSWEKMSPLWDIYEQGGESFLNKQEDGSCIHLVDGKCAVYRDRPAACRAYDCRILAVTNIDSLAPVIQDAVNLWKFENKTKEDEVLLIALRLAGLRLSHDKVNCPEDLAMLEITSYQSFLDEARELHKQTAGMSRSEKDEFIERAGVPV